MRINDTLINIAIKAVEEKVLDQGLVPTEFNGYISSFGAALTNSGLLPTLIFFSQEKESKGNRTSVVKALEFIIIETHPGMLMENSIYKKIVHCVNNKQSMTMLEDVIKESAVALKLAIRIFPKKKKES